MHRFTVLRGALAAGLLVTAACATQDVSAPEGSRAPLASSATTQIPGRYIVLMKPNHMGEAGTAVAAVSGAKMERSYPRAGIALVNLPGAGAASTLSGNGSVYAVIPDASTQWIPANEQVRQTIVMPAGVHQGTDQTGAQFFAQYQWYLRVTSADAAYNVTNGGSGALVCDLDTGIDPNHLDLAGKVDLTRSTSFVAAEPFIEDLNFHGTFTASLISSNGIGMASAAPDAKLCAVKVLDATGNGSFGDVISGIIYAADQGADVINMSLGAYVDVRDPGAELLVKALQSAVDYATASGTLVVSSAGNSAINLDADDPNFIELPAQLSHVVTVGATAPTNQLDFDKLTTYSNYGGLTGVDLMAPGGDLVTGGVLEDLVLAACSEYVCGATNVYVLAAGTSFSAPLTSGAAAVDEGETAGNSDAQTLRRCVEAGVDVSGGRAAIFGRGRLNVLKGAQFCQQ